MTGFTERLTDLSQVLQLSNTNDSSPHGTVSISWGSLPHQNQTLRFFGLLKETQAPCRLPTSASLLRLLCFRFLTSGPLVRATCRASMQVCLTSKAALLIRHMYQFVCHQKCTPRGKLKGATWHLKHHRDKAVISTRCRQPRNVSGRVLRMGTFIINCYFVIRSHLHFWFQKERLV